MKEIQFLRNAVCLAFKLRQTQPLKISPQVFCTEIYSSNPINKVAQSTSSPEKFRDIISLRKLIKGVVNLLNPSSGYKVLPGIVGILICLLAIMPQKSFANVTVTAPSLTVYACGGIFPTGYSPLGNIVISEGANGDFTNGQTNATLILTAPTNFEFLAGTGSTSVTGGNVSVSNTVITATTITITFSVNGTNKTDILTVTGLQVRGISGAATQTITRTGGSGTITGDIPGTVHANLTSASQSVPAVTSSATGNVCNGVAQNYTITSSVSGATYNWSRAVVAGITNAAAVNQTANPITEALVNNTTSPINVTYSIIPTTNGCSGAAFNYVVTVNPTPTLSSSLTQTRCSNISTTYTATSATTGTTFTWTRAAVIGISNSAGSGSGPAITETLVNTTLNPVNVDYAITSTINGCSNTQNVTVTVNPRPTLSSTLTPAPICSNTVFDYTATSALAGTTYAWTRAVVTGISSAAGGGSGASITETLVNTSANPVSVIYVVSTTANGCSNAQNVTVTVNPTPALSSSLTQSRCNNISTTYTATSATPGTTYTWTRASVAGISNAAASGSGAAITENLVNTTTNPIDVSYVITLSANGCTNTQSVTVTVNPTPALSSTLTPAAICNNTAFNYTANSTIAGATFSWTRVVVTGISNAAGTGSGASITETLVNTTASPVNVVYVITSTANGCSNAQNVTVTVNPIPTLSSSLTQNRCNNISGTYTATSATTGTTYTWTRATVAGISNAAGSGSGAATTETLANTTTNSIDVIYAITLSANGCSNAQNVTVTVNPVPTLSSGLSQVWCSNAATTYTATSATTGTTFTWIRAAVTGISNSAGSGSGAAITETLVNTTLNPVNVVYAITSTINGCSNTQNVTVTVNPRPTLSSTLTPAAICSNTVFNYTATSALAGTTYAWTRAVVTGISNAAGGGSGASITETLVNTTANPVSVVYVVSTTANGCSNAQNVTVTVNPTPALSSSLTQSRCDNISTTYTATSATPGTTYTWTRATVGGISNAAGSGSGAAITETLINTTINPVDVTYTITLSANGCTNTQSVTITVNPIPALTTTLTPAAICSNIAFNYTANTTIAGTTFSWTRAAIAGISNAAGSGSGASITETLVNTTASAVNVVYVITSAANGCSNVQNVTVGVNPSPTITTAAAASSVCLSTNAQTTSLTYSSVTGAPTTYSITWDALGTATGFASVINAALPAGAISISVPANAGAATYTGTFTVKNANGCVSNASSFFLTVNPLPAITPAATTNVCFNTSAQTASLTYTFSNSPTSYSINWNAAATTAGFIGVTDVALPSSPILVPVPANAAANSYTGTITVKNSNGCVSTGKNFIIKVNPLPTVTPALSATSVCFSMSAQTTSLPYTVTNSPNTYSITWNAAAIAAGFAPVILSTLLPASGPILISVPANAPVNSYTGTLLVRTAGRCVSSTGANFTVTVNALPQGRITANGPFCNTGTGQLTFTATSGVGPFTVVYNDGTADRTQNNVESGIPLDVFTTTVSSTTTYTLISLTDNNGCTRSAGFTGASATINVHTPPGITTQPASQAICATFPVSFSVVAAGDGLTYQWFKGSTALTDNAFIAGSTTASITIDPVSVSDAGTYHVIVSGLSPCTPAASADAILNVIQEFNITTQPISTQTICETNTATFSVAATGSNLTYQWRKGNTNLIDGGNISGSTTATLILANVTTTDATTASEKYNVVINKVGGTCLAGFSDKASLIVNTNSTLNLLSGSASQTICINSALTNIVYIIGGGGTGASVTGGSLPAGITGSFSGGVFTISGTPTVSGIFNYTVTTTGPCNNSSLNGTLTVNAYSSVTLSSAAVTNSQSICITNAVTNITYLLGGTSTGATVTGLPSGVTGSYNSGTRTLTIAGTPIVTGLFNYTVTSSGPCVRTAVGSITIAPASVGGTLSPSSTYSCSGSNTGTITLTGKTGNVLRWESSTNGGGTWASVANTTTTLTYTNLIQSIIYRAVIQSGVCAISYSSSAAIGINPTVVPSVTASPSVMCLGESSTLNATISYPTVDPFPLETFAVANPAGWSGNDADNNNASPNSTWGETSNGKVFNGVAYNSNAAPVNKMMIVNGTTGAAGNISILSTPVFSAVGLSSATLKWYQAFNLNSGTVAKVEISTDGGTSYNPLVQYSGVLNFGNPNNGFVQVSIPLTGFIGMSNLKVRFYYLGTAGSNWAVDNVEVAAVRQPITYSWSPTTYLSPTTGQTVTSTPTTAGTFPYTLTVLGGSCVLGSATVNVTVSSSPTITLGSNPSVCQKITTASLPYTIISGAPNKYSIVYDAEALAAGFTDVTNAFLPATPITLGVPSAAGAAIYNGILSVNKDGGISCPNSSIPFTITVKPNPSIGSQALGVCNGSTFTTSPTNSGGNVVPAGTTYTWTAPVVTGGITGGSAQSIPQSVIGQTLTNPTNTAQTAAYTVTPVSANCTGLPFTLTVTVNPIPTVTSTTNGNGCGTGSVTLEGTANIGTLNWYANESGGALLGTGFSFTTPSISSTTTFYVEAIYAGCTSPRVPVQATVNALAVITAQPQPATLCPQPFSSLSATFSVAASNAAGYQWQVSTNGGSTWSNVTEGVTYKNVSMNTLTINGITEQMEGYKYRNVVNNLTFCSPVYSGSATLIITNVWKGITSSDWSTASNWWGDVVPDINCEYVIVPNVSPKPFPILAGTETEEVRNIVIRKNAAVKITQSSTLQIRGVIYADISNTSYGTLDGTDGRVELTGGNIQSYGDDETQFIAGSLFYKRTLKDLRISNPLNVTVSGTLRDTLNITGHLSFGNVTDVTLFTGDNITLKSSAAGTASVDKIEIDGAGVALNYISGKAIVERYVPAHRAWRLLTIPVVNDTLSINEAWQEGVVNSTLTYPGGNTNPNPGYGTHITGIDRATDFNIGYDAGPQNNYSLKIHDRTRKTTAIDGYQGIEHLYPGKGTNNTPIDFLQGYMLFIRGDRGINMNLNTAAIPTPTVLRAKGTLKTGTQPGIPISDTFNVIGNPFAATIDMRKIIKTGGGSEFFYLYDTRLGSIGAFQTFSKNSSGNYVPLPGGGSYAAPYGDASSYNFIQSGQAFFVQSFGAGSVIIKEEAKDLSTNSMIFSPVTKGQEFKTNLYTVSTSLTLLDASLTQFSRDGNNKLDSKDAIKIQNISGGTYLGMQRDGKNLVIERRQTISVSDTIFYKLITPSKRTYRFEFIGENLDKNVDSGFLEDAYLKTVTPIKLNDTTTLDFTVNEDIASSAADRFKMVFVAKIPVAPLPVSFQKISANKQNNDIAVEWVTENEQNIESYEIETAVGGGQFVKGATVKANGRNATENYQWLDVNAEPGVHYYRIRSIDYGGKSSYGNTVHVAVSAGKSEISVYPNPVVNNKIAVHFINQMKGNYVMRLIDNLGHVLRTKEIYLAERMALQIITPAKNILPGVYKLEIIGPDSSITTINLVLK